MTKERCVVRKIGVGIEGGRGRKEGREKGGAQGTKNETIKEILEGILTDDKEYH
jgi:hypothetical protein